MRDSTYFKNFDVPTKQAVGAKRDGRSYLSLRIPFPTWDYLEICRRFWSGRYAFCEKSRCGDLVLEDDNSQEKRSQSLRI